MKALNKVTAMLAALCLTSGTALAAPAAPAQQSQVVSETKAVDSNICILIITISSDVTIYEGVCVIFSDGSI